MLTGFAAVVSFYRLGNDIGFDEHECLVAQTAREMRETGDWGVPHYGTRVRLRKTPLPYWVVAGLSLITGRDIDEWIARLPSALASVGLVLCLWWLGRDMFGARAGLVVGFVAASSIATMVFSHDAAVDMQLTFYCALCYALFWKGINAEGKQQRRVYFYGFYVAFGLGMLAKGPMPAPAVALPLFAYLIVTRQWGQLRQMHLVGGAIVVLLIVCPWIIWVAVKVPNVVSVWKAHFLDRFAGELDHAEPERVYYYLPYIFLFSVPWILSVPEALASVFLGRFAAKRRELLYVWLWLIVNLAFFTVAGFKRPHYILPAMPAMFLLLGVVLERLFFGQLNAGRRFVATTTACIILALAIALVGGGFWLAHHPEWSGFVGSYAIAAALAGVGSALAGLSFATGRRGLSFALINVTAAATFGWSRPAIGPYLDTKPDAVAFAGVIRANVPPDADLRWVGKQQGAVMFYGNLKIPRFKDAVTLMHEIQQQDLELDEILLRIGDDVDDRVRQPEPIYLVMKAEDFWGLRMLFDTPARVICVYHPQRPQAGKSLALITNVPTAEGVTSRPVIDKRRPVLAAMRR